MDDFNSETDSDYTSYWRDWINLKMNPSGPCVPDPEQRVLPALGIAIPSKRRMSQLSDADTQPQRLSPTEVLLGGGLANLRSVVAPQDERDLELQGAVYSILETYGLRAVEMVNDVDKPRCWRRHFISSRGNEYFCEIDEDYLTDRFNLTGLNTEVQYYQYALDLVTDVFDLDCDDEMRETIEKSARHLYGLVHARYIVTTRGLSKMLEKYKKADFGKCPRVMCKSHPLLPMGQSDLPNAKAVKLYCARCEDIYNPKSSRHSAIDGAYFGTSFHNIIFQVYPALIPTKSYDRYIPRIYGFKVHAPATLIRWQHGERDDMRRRLRKLEIESGFKDEEAGMDVQDSDEEEEDDPDVEGMENGEMEGGELNNQV